MDSFEEKVKPVQMFRINILDLGDSNAPLEERNYGKNTQKSEFRMLSWNLPCSRYTESFTDMSLNSIVCYLFIHISIFISLCLL